MLYDLGEDGYEMHRMRVKKSEVAYMSYTEHFSLNINLVDSLVIQVLNDMIAKSDFQAFQSTIGKRVEQLSNETEKVSQDENLVAKQRFYVNNTKAGNTLLVKPAFLLQLGWYKGHSFDTGSETYLNGSVKTANHRHRRKSQPAYQV